MWENFCGQILWRQEKVPDLVQKKNSKYYVFATYARVWQKMISRQWPSSIGSFKASLPKPSAMNPATFELEVNVPLTGAAGSLPGYN